MAIWQDLVDSHGFAGRYASVKRFVRKLCGSSPLIRTDKISRDYRVLNRG